MTKYDEWKTTDVDYDRSESRQRDIELAEQEIRSSPERMDEIEFAISVGMHEQLAEIVRVLADTSGCGLLRRLAEGKTVLDCNFAQQDYFARLVRLCDQVSKDVDAAVLSEAIRQVDQ